MAVEEKIPCLICGKYFKAITGSHVGHKHNITLTRYQQMFPEAALESERTKNKSREAKSKNGKANKGSKRTAEFKRIRSEKYKGEGNPFFGKTHSQETRVKLSAHFQGVSQESWEGFSNNEYKRAWKSKRAKRWSQEVFERDDFICALCSIRGGNLEAHHIVPRAKSKELTYDLNNGITLCVSCHRTTFGKEAYFQEGLRAMVKEINSKSLK